MNILIVGSGAREHALVRALARSAKKPVLFACGASPNPGIAVLVKHFQQLPITDSHVIVTLATRWRIDLALIGPEAPLAQGLADLLEQKGIACIGPKQSLARIESSKIFARTLLTRHHFKQAPAYQSFSDLSAVKSFLKKLPSAHYVIKPDGLSAGKGVKVAGEHLHSLAEAYEYCAYLHAQKQAFLIEEQLFGQEFSLHCFCDGRSVLPMPVVKDFKRAYRGNRGPNTGSMGTISDASHRLPFLSEHEVNDALQINQTIVDVVQRECKESYVGILYGSFMLTEQGVRLIEVNARFGDPEALNLLALLDSDFVSICEQMIDGRLSPTALQFAPLASVCKYAVPQGYPEQPLVGAAFDCQQVTMPEHLYLASVQVRDDVLYTSNSRTAAVLGIAPTLAEAERIAEAEINKIQGPLMHREDIGLASSYE